jgi:protocatechuate 3,4-dioxygenase beta subunit
MRSTRTWATLLTALALVAVISWLLARACAPANPETAAVMQARGLAAKAPAPGDDPLALQESRSATVRGTVRDPAGIPIADARVCAWVRDAIGDEEPQCSQSNNDGRYRLSSLTPGHLTLHTSATGFLPRQWAGTRLRVSSGEVREHVDFVLAPGGASLRGVVRDISGGVVEGAWVVARPYGFGPGNRSVARSDAEGQFTLWTRPGVVDLDLEAEGYARTSQLVAAPGPTFDVFLTPESAIVGRVIEAASGTPVEGVTIIASVQGSHVEPASTRSDVSGRFRLDQLEPGIYELEARADDLHGEATDLVHLGLAETVEDVEIELHPAFSVRGRVIVAGSHDRPCTEGRVRLIDRSDDHSSAANSLRDGEVELGGVLPGTYEVMVHCEETIAESEYPDVVVRDANLVDLVWTVHEGQAIHGVVVDGDGSPVAGVRVRAWMRAPPDDPTAPTTDGRSAPSPDDGSFSVTGLLPGTYEVAAEHGATTSAIELVLEPGTDARDVEVVLPPEGAIAGIVRDQQGEPLADIAVQVAPVGSMEKLVAISDEEGRFRLEHVPPGPQRIVVFDDGESGVLAQVEPGDTVEVELVVPGRDGSVLGRVLDSDGSPVADAFIRHQLMTATGGWSSTDAAVLTDADGGFVLDGLLAATPYRIGAFRRGGGEAVVEGVESGDVLTLTLVDMAEIAGQVLTPSGSPPDRFRVTVHRPSTDFIRSDELFRTRGRFRIHELPPADYVVLVESPEGVARAEGIQLEPGEFEQDLVIRLVPRVTVRGRIVDPRTHKPVPGIIVTIGLQGTAVRFGPPRASERARTSGVDGRFEVPHAPTGKVRISIEPRSLDAGYEWQWLDAEVPATGDVVEIGDLELAPAQGR